jgi:ATP-binding cassette subfamily B protein RaxB
MFSRFRHLPLVRQAEGTECGHACLAMIAAWFGHRIDLVSLRMSHATSANGLSVHSMARLAEQIGLKARALRLEPQYLAHLKMPAVLHWDMNPCLRLFAFVRSYALVPVNSAVYCPPVFAPIRGEPEELLRWCCDRIKWQVET